MDHLYVLNNTVVNDLSSGGYWLRTQGDTVALVQNSIFQGLASTAWWGPSTKPNNWITTSAHLASPFTLEYHLTASSTAAINCGSALDPATGIDGFFLIPINQYVHP